MENKNKIQLSSLGEYSGREIFILASSFTAVSLLNFSPEQFTLLRLIPDIALVLAMLGINRFFQKVSSPGILRTGYLVTGLTYLFIFLFYLFGFLNFLTYLALVVLATCGRAFVSFAKEAYIQEVIPSEEVGSFYALLSRISTFCEITIPLIAGFLISTYSGAFAIAVAGALLLILSVLPFLSLPSGGSGVFEDGYFSRKPPKGEQSILAGLRKIWLNRPLRTLTLLVNFYSFLAFTYGTGYYMLVIDRYGISSIEFGVLVSLSAIFMLLSTFLMERMEGLSASSFYLVPYLIVPPSLFLPLLPWILGRENISLPLIFIHEILLGSAAMWIFSSSATLRARIVDPADMKNISATRTLILSSVYLIGALIFTGLSSLMGLEWVMLLLTLFSLLLIPGGLCLTRQVTH